MHAHGVSRYVGKRDDLDVALARFAADYADQNDRDFEALKAAAQMGRIPVEYV